MPDKISNSGQRLTLCVFLLAQVATINANHMSFIASPIMIGVSEEFTLTCRVGEDQGGDSFNMTEVRAIHIVSPENGGMLAFVISHGSVLNGGSNLPYHEYATIHGTLEKNSSKGNLTITWKPAPPMPSSKFECRAFGFDSSKKPQEWTFKLDADIKTPHVTDLVPVIRLLQAKITEMKAEVTNLIKGTIPHSEMGRIQCPKECGCKNIIFKRPYLNIPHITYAPVRLDIEESKNTRLILNITDVSRTGFKLCGNKWGDTVFYGFAMNWFSIGV